VECAVRHGSHLLEQRLSLGVVGAAVQIKVPKVLKGAQRLTAQRQLQASLALMLSDRCRHDHEVVHSITVSHEMSALRKSIDEIKQWSMIVVPDWS